MFLRSSQSLSISVAQDFRAFSSFFPTSTFFRLLFHFCSGTVFWFDREKEKGKKRLKKARKKERKNERTKERKKGREKTINKIKKHSET